jgi:signal transduction histidine kinase
VKCTHDHSPGGLGIGLALVRELVELHGGSVSASSPGLGRGSEFVVCFPAHAEMLESSE